MIKLLLLFTLASPALAAKATVNTLKVDNERLIKIVGPVDFSTIKKASDLLRLAIKDQKKPIYIMLNSPGGSILSGEMFLSAMEQAKMLGVKLVCFSSVYAASMAFSIMVHCDERYAFANTRLLFHPARINTDEPLTAPRLKEIYADLEVLDAELLDLLTSTMQMPRDVVEFHYYKETWLKASILAKETKNFLQIVQGIIGVSDLFQYERENNTR